jgi:hypothetical protein
VFCVAVMLEGLTSFHNPFLCSITLLTIEPRRTCEGLPTATSSFKSDTFVHVPTRGASSF